MRIGEAAAAAGMTTKALRFYEERGLLPAPGRTANGYRHYPPETLGRLDFIRRSRAAGLSLSQIGDILALRDSGGPPCGHVRDLLARELEDLDRRIGELASLRAAVAGFHRRLTEADPAGCDPEQICSFL